MAANESKRPLTIRISAPGKVILHGEHSVVYGKRALAASLGLRTRLSFVENIQSTNACFRLIAFDYTYVVDFGELKRFLNKHLPLSSNIEQFDLKSPTTLDHSSLIGEIETFIGSTIDEGRERLSFITLFYLFAIFLRPIKIEDFHSFQLDIQTDLTIGAGTGSSASFIVCVVAFLITYIKHKNFEFYDWSKPFDYGSGGGDSKLNFNSSELELICEWSYWGERIIHGTPSGIDNTICTYGSFLEYSKGLKKFLKNKMDIEILLIDTKISRDTKRLIKMVNELKNKHPDMIDKILDAMDDIVGKAVHHYGSLNDDNGGNAYEHLEELCDINHSLLSALGVSHPKLEEIRQILLTNNLHGKLTGAGGGGYIFAIIPPTLKNNLSEIHEQLKINGFDVIVANLGGDGVRVD